MSFIFYTCCFAKKTPPHSFFTSDFTAADNTLPLTSFTPTATAGENTACPLSYTPAATENTDGNPPLEDDVGPVGSDSLDEGSDFSTNDCEQSVHEIIGEDEEGYTSDDPEEVRELRVERRSVVQRRKRRKRAKHDSEKVPAGEASMDLGFDETEIGRVSLEGRLGYDEPYYGSSDDDSFQIDEDECWDNEEDIESGGVNVPRRNNAKNKIIHDPTAKKVVWQLGMVFKDVNEFRGAATKYVAQKKVLVEKFVNEPKRVRVRVRCRDGCPWVLQAKLDNTTNDFQIKTYNPKHTCLQSTRNYLCNAKFIVEVYRKRITEQPNIRVFKLQELIRKKFDLHVGKTTVRRARAKILKEIISDHILEFGRILDYKDELLRTNPGSTCVVKLAEPNADGKPVFKSFYIYFDALKKAFQHCRKCIGMDGYFLKAVCRGQLVVAVCKDGNNQIVPLAWVVVEYENKNTWTWCISI
ncbi:uncharacterized protein LOC132611273 [Lycium barbarum]|uniref:uncharacterized protein LOC132611273 n=1 Tax=Lycium barbarum TaxID=112863 RepID=UPI00293F4CDC|nr:uncharacterized protein LOC132611273 [Lycium barbarum]